MPIVRLALIKNSREIVLPMTLLQHLGLAPGDFVEVMQLDGKISIAPCNAALQKQLKIAWQVMDERRDVLQRLADL